MSVPTYTVQTYAMVGLREDLTNLISNISPVETPFFAMCKRDKAKATYHEWQTDSLAAAASNVQVEGDDADLDQVSATTRLGNYTQISRKVVGVSGTQEAVDKAGRKSEMAYQITKSGKELKRDMEKMLTENNARVVGDASTARELQSMEAWIKTNSARGGGGADPNPATGTAATDGTQRAFTETLLKTVLTLCWTNGADPKYVLLGPHNKQDFSGFSGVATLYKDLSRKDKVVIGAVDIYVSDWGEVKAVPDRFSRDRTASCIDPNMWAICYLRPMFVKNLAITGDSTKKAIYVEYTLKCRNPEGNGVVADLLTS